MAETPPVENSPAAETPSRVSLASLGFYPLLMVGLILGVAMPWGIWLLLSEPEASPYEQSEEALELLEAGRTRSAYELALKLLQEKVSDPEIGGNLEYVVGVAHFRKAENVSEHADTPSAEITQPIYELAMKYLEQASIKTFKPELKPGWAYVLGSCYFQLDRLYEARELLELAYQIAPEKRGEIVCKLAECYLDPNVLQSSLEMASNVLQAQQVRKQLLKRIEQVLQLPPTQQQLTKWELLQLQRNQAELQLQQQQYAAVAQILQQIQQQSSQLELTDEQRDELQDAEQILQARTELQQGRTKQAREKLKTLVQEKSGLEQNATLQAYYLMGMSYAQDGRYDLALEHLEKPALMTDTKICLPANLQAGEIARKRGLHEEALVYYLRGLNQVKSLDDFTNRWISLIEARQLIQSAWDDWGSSGRYEHFRFTTELAERVVPLFTPEEAHQLMAVASRKRAEIIQAETDALKPDVEREQEILALEHWKQAGRAYARLASSTQSSEIYGQNLWEAGLLFRRGNDFPNALKMIEQFLHSNPRTGIPAGQILKARLLMDLTPYQSEENLAQVIVLLQNLLRDYPKDQSVYEAQMLLGQAYLEAGQSDKAMQMWRSLLQDSPLTPEASEWQAAMFALGRTLFLTSETRPDILLQREDAAPAVTDSAVNYEHVDEAIHWLKEFVRRNPQHPRVLEARWLLGKGLRYRIQKPATELQTAETENTRVVLMKEIQQLAEHSIEQFKLLEVGLIEQVQQELLDEVTLQFLRDAYFEPAHIQYDLGKYDSTGDRYRAAIDAYSNAAFHFTGDPIVLMAYFRIAECYRELHAEAEARRQLEQARVVLSQLQEPFPSRSTNFNRQQWELLLEQSIRLYDLALESQPVPSE